MPQLNYVLVRNSDELHILKILANKGRLTQKNPIAVIWDGSLATHLKTIGISYLEIRNYAKDVDYNALRNNLIEMLKNFPHKKILDNKTFVELLDYNGYSLWWFIRQGFYSQCLRVMKEIHSIKLLIKKEKIKELTILNNDYEFTNIIKEAIKGMEIKLNFPDKSYLQKNNHYLKNKKEPLLDNFPRIIRIIQGFFRSFQIRNNGKRKNILIFTKSHVWSGLGGNLRGDPYFYPIMRHFLKSQKYNPIPLDIALTREGAWTAIREKKKPYIPYDYFIFKSFFNGNIKKDIKSLKARLKNLWKRLDKNKELEKIIMCDGVSIYQVLKHNLRSYFFDDFNSLMSAARNIEIGKKILEGYGIHATLCIDENDAAMFLVFASNMNKIPSLGLQHGVITPLGSIAYNHSEEDLHKYKGNLSCHLADRTAVYGNYFKKLLIKWGNYPADMIVVTGQPRMDIVFENKKTYSKGILYKRLGINRNDKLIIYATEFMGDESKIALSALIRALKQLKNVKLLVKLHPADDKVMYVSLLKELKYDAIISRDIDLYELIICSDLLISIQSTVILESLALGTPVIQLNLLEKYNVFGEEANKVIKRVTNEKDLHDTIKKILHDKPFFGNIKKKMKKFVSEYYYKIDDKSSERVVKELNKLLKTKKTI